MSNTVLCEETIKYLFLASMTLTLTIMTLNYTTDERAVTTEGCNNHMTKYLNIF